MAELIRILSDEVIDRIAAGEVVERPASLVKELCENAIDAGAENVAVDVEQGGLARVSVSDDGCGMAGTEAPRALLRHATSKLWRAEDLVAIRTLGFRGEALSSIAAVSRLTLTTRRPEDAVGTRLVVEGGRRVATAEIGCPVGTTVDVRDLFYNTPARREFLRSAATEQAHLVEAATRVLLGARRAGITLQAGSRRLLDLPADAPADARARLALGGRVDAVYPLAHTHAGVSVSGFVPRPEVNRADARGIWIFVNGRYVRDRMLGRAILDGYRSLLERGRHPILCLFIDLEPGAVDVNVHPQKLEVRFREPAAVFQAVSSAIVQVLARSPWLTPAGGRRAAIPVPPPVELRDRVQAYRVTPAVGPTAPPLPLPLPARGPFSRLQPVGQIFGTFLVCADDDALVLIDQHAAHERVVFAALSREAAAGSIDVDPGVAAWVEQQGETLVALGFELCLVGPRQVALRAIPAALGAADARALAAALLDEVATWREAGTGQVSRDAQVELLSRVACHAAVRAHDRMSVDEIAALLLAMDEVDLASYCPHGRPVIARLGRAELARLFHRG
jgi:DNA mismatch repair protein MutL